MEIALGFDGRVGQGKMSRLKKTLYGLKQSFEALLGRFTMLCCKWDINKAKGIILYFKHTKGDSVTIILVYADDIIVTGNY